MHYSFGRTRNGALLAVVLSAAAALAPVQARAAEPSANQAAYPQRPVRIVVPYAPGGGTDINARNVAPRLTERWKQTVVIDNRPGGNAMIGADIVAKAAPDGHTLLLSTSSEIVTVTHLFKHVPYDPLKDLAPVTLASITPVVITAHPSTNIKSIKELIASAGSRKLSFASVGTASPQHLAGEWLKALAKIDMVHIPFKGAGPALNDNLGGHVPIGFLSLLPVVPHAKAGRLNVLAVTSARRSPALPDAPAMNEVGYPDIELVQWYGVFLPGATPRSIIDKLNADMNASFNMPDVKERLAAGGADVFANFTPAQFAKFVLAETEKNRKVIQAAGVKVE
jgi:tripartite-type tricarboxylate transporter receptor subunit TctC